MREDGLALLPGSPNDRVGLTIFSDRVHSLVPIAPVWSNKAPAQGTIRDLIADGGTAFHDATAEGVETVRQLATASASTRWWSYRRRGHGL